MQRIALVLAPAGQQVVVAHLGPLALNHGSTVPRDFYHLHSCSVQEELVVAHCFSASFPFPSR